MTEGLVADLTGSDPSYTADPYPLFAELRERGPVHRARVLDGRDCWLITDYEAARAAFADPRLSNDIRYLKAWENLGRNVVGKTLMQVDPPDHTRLRKFIAREFTLRRVQSMRPRVERIAHDLLDSLLRTGEADLVESYALPLPLSVICELLGVPEGDRGDFHQWSSDLSAPPTPERGNAAQEAMTAYLSALVDTKRKEGGEDLLGAMARAVQDDGDRLSPEELLGMAFLLLVGGHESTANVISSGTLALLRNPGQLAALRADWSLLETTVEEVLRFDGPVEVSAYRYTTEPVRVGDTEIPAGEVVLIGMAAVGRDSGRFPEAERFDIGRELREVRAHLAFGHGVHHCVGAPLARMESAIALRALLERCPDLALAVPYEDLTWKPPTFQLRGLEHLPVRFTPAGPAPRA
ncbi:cytochrome P450 family protein [Streptomyces lushanensis]|uniref:cytochrome P450 family protein n=1 Tax=Streptomyces lushanensis TaxID=1434255 RepID=UPI00082BDCBB|nr:cytochrome P450 [Streptomyces lushanensis]